MSESTESEKYSSEVEYSDNNPWRDESTLRELYWENELTLTEIAERYDVTHQAIQYWFEKHEIERRELSAYSDDTYSNDAEPPAPNEPDGHQSILCSNCGTTFKIQPNRMGDAKFCSKKCSREGYQKSEFKREWKRCGECGESFYDLPRRQFCSHECYWSNIDEGGRSLARRYRRLEKRVGWVESVFGRDDYECQKCGEQGGDLHAHHTKPVAEIVDEIQDKSEIEAHPLFNDTSNGVTLCVDCHRDEHYGGTD